MRKDFLNGSAGSVFFGDLSYANTREYDFRAKVAAWGPQTVAYRRAGVSGLCPWTEMGGGTPSFPLDLNPETNALYRAQKEAYRPLAVFLREVDSRFFSGDTVVRTFDVFNDTAATKELELKWRLEPGGSSGSRRLVIEPAGTRVVRAELKMPKVRAKKGVLLAAELLADGRRAHSLEQSCSVQPRRDVRAPRGVELLLFDPRNTAAAPLKQAGLRVRRVKSLSALRTAGGKRTILIVAPGALEAPGDPGDLVTVGAGGGAGELAEFLAAGGRALVLAQESLAGLPLGAELVWHHSTMTFPLATGHPILKGVDPEDLKFWRPGHYVTYREVRRPSRGGGKAVTVSGGGSGVGQSPILDVPVGRGVAVLCQALVAEKLSVEPVARKLLGNTLDYLSAYEPPAGRTLGVGLDEAFSARLRALGVRFTAADSLANPDELADVGLVILHGGGSAIRAAAPVLKKAMAGRALAVYWHEPDRKTFAAAGSDLGFSEMTFEAASGPIVLRSLDDPVMSGLARQDVDYRGASIGPSWMGARDPDPTIIDRVLVPGGVDTKGRRLEVETFDLEGDKTAVSEDGQRVDFFSNGSASTGMKIARAGLYAVSVLASGTPAKGGFPLIVLAADGRQVGMIQLTREEVRAYSTLAELPAGEFTFRLSFVNDSYAPPEDRNLFVDAVVIGAAPVAEGSVSLLSMPAALAAAPAGKGRVVVDCVKWDTTTRSRAKGERYANVLLRNLGASFETGTVAADWIPAGSFRKVDGGPYFEVGANQINYHSWGEAGAEFVCAKDGRYAVWVRGRSTPAEGEYGKALITIDGREAGEVEVKGESVQGFRLDAAVMLTRGKHEVKVRFSNDVQIGDEDRNLYVTALGFALAK